MVILAAVVGLLLGHTLDVFFDRLYTDGPLAGPAYRCPHCRHAIRPLHLIPIVGVAWSRGRCPDCRRHRGRAPDLVLRVPTRLAGRFPN